MYASRRSSRSASCGRTCKLACILLQKHKPNFALGLISVYHNANVGAASHCRLHSVSPARSAAASERNWRFGSRWRCVSCLLGSRFGASHARTRGHVARKVRLSISCIRIDVCVFLTVLWPAFRTTMLCTTVCRDDWLNVNWNKRNQLEGMFFFTFGFLLRLLSTDIILLSLFGCLCFVRCSAAMFDETNFSLSRPGASRKALPVADPSQPLSSRASQSSLQSSVTILLSFLFLFFYFLFCCFLFFWFSFCFVLFVLKILTFEAWNE